MGRASNHSQNHRGSSTEYRKKLMRKIHATWRDARPDLRHSPEELRSERLAYCQEVLGLSHPVESMTELSDDQLVRVIEALTAQTKRTEPAGPNVRPFRRPAKAVATKAASTTGQSEPASKADQANSIATPGAGPQEEAEIIHLASKQQVWAINRLYDYIGWTRERREEFLREKFRRVSPAMLTPRQAHSYTVILINVAAQKDIKREHPEVKKVTREMIREYMPELMKRMGIGQGRKG